VLGRRLERLLPQVRVLILLRRLVGRRAFVLRLLGRALELLRPLGRQLLRQMERRLRPGRRLLPCAALPTALLNCGPGVSPARLKKTLAGFARISAAVEAAESALFSLFLS
jgi:hypothetical protein